MNLQSGMYLKISDDGRFEITDEKDLGKRLLLKTFKGKD